MSREIQFVRKPRRTLCISDIHGCFHLLKQLIEHSIRFNPEEDELIFMGDYIDLAGESMKVVMYLQILKEHYPDNIILLLGNHEHIAHRFFKHPADDPIKKNGYFSQWLRYGGKATLDSFGSIRLAQGILVPFIESLVPYHETNTHIFVHGGIPKGVDNILDASVHDLIWDRSYEYGGHKPLIVGHRPHKNIQKVGNIICVDTGAYWYGKMSAYDALNDIVYEAIRNPRDRTVHKTQRSLHA